MAGGDDTDIDSVRLSSYHQCYHVIAGGALSVQDQGQTAEDEAHIDAGVDHPPDHVLYT